MKLVWSDVPLILIFLFAMLVVYTSMSGFNEHFGRFEDTTNRDRTDALSNSSYKQATNHLDAPNKFDAGPIQGVETPFQVNMWKAYI